MLRLVIGPSPRTIASPAGYRLERGRGWRLHEGKDALVFAYGPVMLHEALAAAEWLDREGLSIAVVNQPWLNVVDPAWLAECVGPYSTLVVIEDHGPVGALGDHLGRALVAHGLLEGAAVSRLRRGGLAGVRHAGGSASGARPRCSVAGVADHRARRPATCPGGRARQGLIAIIQAGKRILTVAVVGKALADFTGPGTDVIDVFVNVR